MPLGGERIGSAYIRIYGDGSGLPDDIEDSLNQSEPRIRAAGRRMGEAYEEEFRGGITRDEARDFGRTLRENMDRSIAEGDLSSSYFESEDWKRFQGRLRQQFGEAGTVAGESLERRFREAGSNRGLSDAIRNIVAEVNQAQADINDAEADAIRIRDANRDEEFERDIRRLAEHARIEREFDDLERRYEQESLRHQSEDRDRAFDFELQRQSDYARLFDEAAIQQRRREEQRARETIAINDRLEQSRRESLRNARDDYNDLTARITALSTAERRSGDSRLRLRRDLDAIRAGLSGATAGRDRDRLGRDLDALQTRLRRAHPEIDRFNVRLTQLSDLVGRGFGRGSRNNFVNFLGSAASGITNLLTLAPRLIFTVGRRMVDAFENAGGGVKGVVAAVGQLALGAGITVAAIGALGVAALALVFVLGPLAALISGITAALIALVATVAFAATAGIVALAGALVPLAAGFGVGVAAVLGMSDAMKDRLQPELDATKKALSGLGKDASDALGPKLEIALGRLPGAVSRIRPAVSLIADALGDLSISYAEAFDSDRFGEFVRITGPFLANRIRDLGDAARYFGEGLGGVFVAARPLIRDFTGYLVDINKNFSEFANSTEGRNSIAEFLDDAAGSARSLGKFIGAVSGTLFELLDAGNETGDTIFDDLTEQFRGFTDYLTSHPDAVNNFFANGLDVARDLGRFVEFLFGLIDDLDTEQSRRNLQDFFDALSQIGDLIQDLAPVIEGLGNVFETVSDGIGVAVDAYRLLGETLQAIFTLDFTGFGSKFNDFANSIADYVGIDKSFGESTGHMASATELLSTVMDTSKDKVDKVKESFDRYAGTLDDTTGAITANTRAAVGANLAQSNLIGTVSLLGLTQRDIINAATGSAAAMDKVTAAIDGSLKSTKPADIAQREYVRSLQAFVGAQSDAIRVDQERARTTSRNKQMFDDLKGSISAPLLLKLESKGIEPTINGLAKTVIRYDELNNRKDIEKIIKATGVDTTVEQVLKVKDRIERLRATKADLRPFVESVAKGVTDGGIAAEKASVIGDVLNNRIVGVVNARAGEIASAAAASVRAAILAAAQAARQEAGTRYTDPSTGAKPKAPTGPQVPRNGRGIPPVIDSTTEYLNRGIVTGTGGTAGVAPSVRAGRTVDASGWTLVSQVNDPEAVAAEVINELTARTF